MEKMNELKHVCLMDWREASLSLPIVLLYWFDTHAQTLLGLDEVAILTGIRVV